MSLGSHLLLTGATGLIGSRWLPKLLDADSARRVTVLSRTPLSLPHSRVNVAIGDLGQPALGLDPAVWHALAATLTDIVHCGADVRFNRPLAEARAVNTQGTLSLLALARQSRRLRRFAHISSTYVMGRDAGLLPEREYLNRNGFVNTYQQAKYEAERAVFAAMPGIPAAVFRLSSVIGKQTNYFHQALRFIPRNPFPIMPAAPDCRMDFISDGWAVAALSTLFERHFAANAVFHVCAGPDGCVPVAQLVGMAFSRFAAGRVPAMVPLVEFERFADAMIRGGAREPVQIMLQNILSFLPHLAIDQTFENSVTEALLRREGVLRPDSLQLLREVLAHVAGGELPRVPVPACQPVGRDAHPVEEL